MKYPVKGQVKTRLAEDLGEDRTLEIYKTLVENTIRTVKNHAAIPYDIIIYLDNEKYTHETASWLSLPAEKIFIQTGNDLGEKMANAFQQQLLTFEKAVIIGTDIPGLSFELIKNALEKLGNSDAVIGPAVDGGYYLLGLKNFYSELFTGIKWSTDRVLKQTLAAAKSLNLTVTLLEKKRDIDTLKDLEIENFSSYSGV